MTSQLIRTGSIEPIYAQVADSFGEPLTGATDIVLRIRRDSDGQFFDFDDDTFKASGHVEQDRGMSEVGATLTPGLYKLPGDLNTGAITNLVANDVYQVVVLQDPGTDAALPSTQELRIGHTADGLAELTTSATVESTVPGTIRLIAWLALDGAPLTTGLTSATVEMLDDAGSTVFAATSMLGPSSEGVFRLDVPFISLAIAQQFYTRTVLVTSSHTYVALVAHPTIG